MKRIYMGLILMGLVDPLFAGSMNTISFDEPGVVIPPGAVVSVASIDDLAFGGLKVFDATNLYGHINLAVSGTNAAYFGPSDILTVSMTNGGSFDFKGAYFGSTHGASFTLQGFKAGTLAFSGTANSPQFTPAQFIANWTGIDFLAIQSVYFETSA